MRGVRHHVGPEESPFGPKDVVPPDGGKRLCGEGDANKGAGGPDWAGQKSFLHMERHSPWN